MASCDKFREAFWMEVWKNPGLAKEFMTGASTSNLTRMQKGLAPFATKDQQVGKARQYVLHHQTPMHADGGVYRTDNLLIVTPLYHQSILDPLYHYAR